MYVRTQFDLFVCTLNGKVTSCCVLFRGGDTLEIIHGGESSGRHNHTKGFLNILTNWLLTLFPSVICIEASHISVTV